MVDPNLAAILDYLRDLANDTMACQFIFAICMIGVIGYGWRTIWRGVKITGDVIHHLRSKDWNID